MQHRPITNSIIPTNSAFSNWIYAALALYYCRRFALSYIFCFLYSIHVYRLSKHSHPLYVGILNIKYIPLISHGINSFQINQNTKQTNKLGNHGINSIYFAPLTFSLALCSPVHIPSLSVQPWQPLGFVKEKGSVPEFLLLLFVCQKRHSAHESGKKQDHHKPKIATSNNL